MRSPICLTIAAALVFAMRAEAGPPQTDEQKTIYALGLALSRNLGSFNLTPQELEFVTQGLSDGVLNKTPVVTLEEFGPKIQELQKTRLAASAEIEKKKGKEFLDKAAAEKGAKKLPSGLVIIEITPGKGDAPKPTDKVKVHYHGTLADGTVFDSSVERKQPATFPLNGVVPCWTEGLQQMKPGGKAKLVCPSDLAYGDRGSPPKIKPGSTLVFEVELLEILPVPTPGPKPAAPGAPAPGAAPNAAPLPKK